MIEQIGSADAATIEALREVLAQASWEVTDTEERRYRVWHGVLDHLRPVERLSALWPQSSWHQAFFLAIPPGGYVHRHRDTDDVYESFHVPVLSNDQCVTFGYDTELGVAVTPPREYRMEVGSVYAFDRTREHSSVNRGKTDRIHLIMEILKC